MGFPSDYKERVAISFIQFLSRTKISGVPCEQYIHLIMIATRHRYHALPKETESVYYARRIGLYDIARSADLWNGVKFCHF